MNKDENGTKKINIKENKKMGIKNQRYENRKSAIK